MNSLADLENGLSNQNYATVLQRMVYRDVVEVGLYPCCLPRFLPATGSGFNDKISKDCVGPCLEHLSKRPDAHGCTVAAEPGSILELPSLHQPPFPALILRAHVHLLDLYVLGDGRESTTIFLPRKTIAF